MGAKAFFAKGWPTRLAFFLGKYLPPACGYPFVAALARTMATLKPDLYYDARANLRHVFRGAVSDKELDRAVYRLFRHAMRGYYELFHNVGRGELDVTRFRPPVTLDPAAKTYIEDALATGRGLMILGAHVSNFDLAWIGLSQHISVQMQALSLADPPPGFEFFNHLREKGNVLLTPIAPRSLRDAMARLRQGGIVLTGVDRPIGEGDEPVEFFGATAYLPTGYIRIPLRTDALVMTMAARFENGEYRVIGHPPMAMERTGDAERDIAHNVRRVLAQIEAFILHAPDQWMMFLPVWRDEV